MFLGAVNSIASKLSVWEEELHGDIDSDFILDGLRKGFRISNISSGDEVKEVSTPNHGSAYRHKELVEKELKYQISRGFYVTTNDRPKVISPIGAILKDNGVDVRIIHDGSQPFGEAMNDYSLHHSVKYQTLNEALELATPGTYLCKVDLRSAYRSVPINCIDYCMTGLQWTFEGDDNPTYLFDTRVPFGSGLGPMIFHRNSQAVRRFMYNRGYNNMVVYLDDFFIAEDSYERCREAQHVLLSLLIKLGFEISWSKVVGPSQCVNFLGVLIDTRDCTLSLDSDKLFKLYNKLLEFKTRKRASKRQLQSLAGSLNWACQAIRGGRYFLRRILNDINKLRHGSHKCRLSGEFHKDLEWWISYLHVFNGSVYYRRCEQVNVYTDACNTGAGMFCEGDWSYVNWQADDSVFRDVHINYQEVGAIMLSASRWAHTWRDKQVVVFTDSTVAKAIINKGTCRNKVIMNALRKLFWLSVTFNFTVRAVHIPGIIHIVPDCISRLHENGQILHLMSLLAQWHHARVHYNVNWFEHMSYAAFQVLQERVYKMACMHH